MLAQNTTVIIPTLNEEKNISLLLHLIHSLYPGINTLVVDDGSTDSTREIAIHNGAQVIDRTKQKTKGLCASVLEGISNTKTSFFIVMDGDLQHPPEAIFHFLKHMQTYEVIVGQRKKVVVPWPLHRRGISKLATLLAKMRLWTKKEVCNDPLSGFFGGRTVLFQKMITKHKKRFTKGGYKVLFDFLKVLPRKTRIKNVPYVFGLRKGGASKMTSKHIWYFLRSVGK